MLQDPFLLRCFGIVTTSTGAGVFPFCEFSAHLESWDDGVSFLFPTKRSFSRFPTGASNARNNKKAQMYDIMNANM